MKTLTPAQRLVLEKMKKGKQLTFAKGGGWWIGEDKTNGKLVFYLFKKLAISQDVVFANSEYFKINETGLNLLK